MSLETQLSSFAARTRDNDNAIKTFITGGSANLSALATTDKTSIVAAINEVLSNASGTTDLAIGLNNASTLQITSSTGNNITLPGATALLAGLLEATDKVKINSIAAGATQNDTDFNLRDRSTHTGTQTSATISDFRAAVGILLVNLINDTTNSATTTWSSNKVQSEINGAISTALEGEDLSDLALAIADLQISDSGLVSTQTSQSFSTAEQLQARTNIGAVSSIDIGDTNIDLVAIFETGLI